MLRGPILAIDTATSRAVVAIGDATGEVVLADVWPAGHRHSEELLPRVDAVLRAAAIASSELGAIAVGTGPGAFTGLRVGLATAKTLAHELGLPIVGVSSGEALLRASALAAAGSAPGVHRGDRHDAVGGAVNAVLLLPAGSTDRILVRPGARPELLPGGVDPALEPGESVVAVDLGDRAPAEAIERGTAALNGMPAALLRLAAERLRSGATDDVATLVPEYVTLPRGIRQATGAIEWSRDHR